MLDFIAKGQFFSYVPADDLKLVNQYLRHVVIAQDEILFNEGDPGDSVYFIVEGALEVLKTNSLYELKPIAKLMRGDSIGEMTLIDGQPRSATTRALLKTDLLTLSRSMFDRIVETEPKLGIALLKGLAVTVTNHLRHTSGKITN